jgi:hypothetical protein
MTPDDLSTVQRSWTELGRRRPEMAAELCRQFEAAGVAPVAARHRTEWLLVAVGELVELLPAPSRLATRACDLGKTWPDPVAAPSYGVEGTVWMSAAGACHPGWSDATEGAWRQAWLLLSDVLAAETLSPFTDGNRPAPTA